MKNKTGEERLKEYNEMIAKCKWFAVVTCKNGVLKSWGARSFVVALFRFLRLRKEARKWNGGVITCGIISAKGHDDVERAIFGIE